MLRKMLTLTDKWATVSNITSFFCGLFGIFCIGVGVGIAQDTFSDRSIKLSFKKDKLERERKSDI